MKCRPCVSGKTNICHTLGLERQGVMHSDKKTRFSIKGKPVYHYCAVSSFSEYTVVHSGCAVKISPIAPLEKICLLSCGVAAGTYLTSSFPRIMENMPSKLWSECTHCYLLLLFLARVCVFQYLLVQMQNLRYFYHNQIFIYEIIIKLPEFPTTRFRCSLEGCKYLRRINCCYIWPWNCWPFCEQQVSYQTIMMHHLFTLSGLEPYFL